MAVATSGASASYSMNVSTDGRHSTARIGREPKNASLSIVRLCSFPIKSAGQGQRQNHDACWRLPAKPSLTSYEVS